jgi:DUF917 family protein
VKGGGKVSRTIKEQELADIITGATFLAAGGGGAPEQGFKLLEELKSLRKAEVTLVDLDEMADDAWATMVAIIGAPRAMLEAKSSPEAVTAFKAMQAEAARAGRNITYLMAGELGGANTMVPLYVAALEGVPFVDADGNGRAVPELATGLYPAGGIPESPMTMAASNGDTIIIHLKNELDHESAESIARHICMAYGMKAAFSTWVVNREMIVDKLAPKSISRCMTVGKAFREATGIDGLAKALEKDVGAKRLFVGEISKIELKTEGGFDFGTTYLSGTGTWAGKSMSIDFKNENMLLRDQSKKVLGTIPDLISLVDLETMSPLTNADTAEGQRVALFGAKAVANWFKGPMAFDSFRHILTKLGYDGGYVPVQ